MRRKLLIAAVCLFGTACAPNEDDSTSTVIAYLNGVLATSGNLTRKTYTEPDEANRQTDTSTYYNSVLSGTTGTIGDPIGTQLGTLSAFRLRYGFTNCTVGAADCPQAFYYNRGDLGIGREMHCHDGMAQSQQEIACYVSNFSAGDLNPNNDGEFRFGLSSNIAFDNMAAGNVFATVAMVYRDLAPAKDKVFFIVYDGNGKLAKSAALDRNGFNFALGKTDAHGNVGTPGVNFNNHIPSNCVACHGGNGYDHNTHSETGGLFLPFDLDQFEYQAVAGRTRADQAVQFQHLNEIVRKVAARTSAPAGASIKNQLDTWYANTVFASDNRREVFENPFDSAAIPSGWTGSAAAATVYSAVVRPSCRNCHMAQSAMDSPVGGLSFDTENEFLNHAVRSVADLCQYQMPHSQQTLRQFWQSQQARYLEDYLNAKQQTTAASTLHGCGPGDVATLDPPAIATSVDIP